MQGSRRLSQTKVNTVKAKGYLFRQTKGRQEKRKSLIHYALEFPNPTGQCQSVTVLLTAFGKMRKLGSKRSFQISF